MTLRQKQSQFAVLVARLIDQATRMGFDVTLGEAWRPPVTAEAYAKAGKGVANSLHIQRLAIDINLFRDGVFLEQTEHHHGLGEWWEAQSTADYTCCWGGRFSRPDGNHYSLEHGGVR